jgi:hypothetical protein
MLARASAIGPEPPLSQLSRDAVHLHIRVPVKKEFPVDPLNGVGPVHLGMSREAVLAAFGSPTDSFRRTSSSRYPTDAWFENSFQVSYDGDEPTVAFIELCNDSNLEAVVFGLPVFTTAVSTLIREIECHAALDETDPELGYSYTFPKIELAFWRPDNDDEETPYFATIGIGVAGYFSALVGT